MNETIIVIIRAVIGFFTLLIYARLLGKQQISQLSYFDYILGITIGSTASTLTTDLTATAWSHWIGLTVWVGLVFILRVISLRSRQVARYIDGEPTVVIMNGQIMEKKLKQMHYRAAEIMALLRAKNVFDLSEVEFAVLEANGELSVLKKSQYQSLTPKDMGISTEYKGLTIELIYDGVVIEQNLQEFKLDRLWLDKQLNKLGINDVSEVMLATLDTQGKLYIDTYKDHLETAIDISDYEGPN